MDPVKTDIRLLPIVMISLSFKPLPGSLAIKSTALMALKILGSCCLSCSCDSHKNLRRSRARMVPLCVFVCCCDAFAVLNCPYIAPHDLYFSIKSIMVRDFRDKVLLFSFALVVPVCLLHISIMIF